MSRPISPAGMPCLGAEWRKHEPKQGSCQKPIQKLSQCHTQPFSHVHSIRIPKLQLSDIWIWVGLMIPLAFKPVRSLQQLARKSCCCSLDILLSTGLRECRAAAAFPGSDHKTSLSWQNYQMSAAHASKRLIGAGISCPFTCWYAAAPTVQAKWREAAPR